MAPRRLTPADLDATEEEKRAARIAAEGGAGARGLGSTIGSAAGGALGALGFLVPGAGAALGPALISAGSGLGGMAGDAIGGKLAEGDLEDAEETLSAAELQRRKRMEAYRLRQEALGELLSEG